MAVDLAAFVAVTHAGQALFLGSFHGDTNGRATIPIVSALEEYAATNYPEHVLVYMSMYMYI